MEHIYTLTVIRMRPDGAFLEHSHTWGWYRSQEEAQTSVIADANFFFEVGYYKYAVIEKMSWGGCADIDGEWWYEATWNVVKQTHEVERIQKPAVFDRIVGFAMG